MSLGELSDVVERLAAEAEEGHLHTGAQLVVVRQGEVLLDAAVGRTHLRAPFRSDTLSALYCTAKPLLAVTVLHLVARGALTLDDRVGDVLDGQNPGLPSWLAERNVEQILAHTAGLHALPSVVARVLPESKRWDAVVASSPAVTWRPGVDRAYSEFGGWYVLGRLVEAVCDAPYDRVVNDVVLDGYGIDHDEIVVRFDPNRFARLRSRISVTLDLTDLRPVPLLAEAGVETACEWNPAFGSYGTMRGLARLYEGLLADLSGADRVVPARLLADAVRARLPVTHDPVLGRDACFGRGFMAPLSSHEFGDVPSPSAFGHTGQGGTSFGLADPEHQVVVAALFNGGLDAATALGFRRRGLLSRLYRAVSAT